MQCQQFHPLKKFTSIEVAKGQIETDYNNWYSQTKNCFMKNCKNIYQSSGKKYTYRSIAEFKQ